MGKRIVRYCINNKIHFIKPIALLLPICCMWNLSGCIDGDDSPPPVKTHHDIEVKIELDSMNKNELGQPDISYFDEVLNDYGSQESSNWGCDVKFMLNGVEDDTSPTDHPGYYARYLADDAEGKEDWELAYERADAWEDKYWTGACQDIWEAHLLYAFYYSSKRDGDDLEIDNYLGLSKITSGLKTDDKSSVVFIETIKNVSDKINNLAQHEVIPHVIAHELGYQWDIDPDREGCTHYCAMSKGMESDILKVCTFCKYHFRGFQHSPSCIPSYICSYSAGGQMVEIEDEARPLEDLEQNEIITSNELSLNVESDQDKYYFGEPIRLLVKLSNISKNPIHVWDSIEPILNVVKIIVCYPNGKKIGYKLPVHVFSGIVDKENYKGCVLEPGESLREFYYPLISATVPGYLFPKAGVYSIRATYEANLPGNKYLWQGTITSESKNISIREPKRDDLEALALFEKLEDVRACGDGYALLHTREDIEEDREVFDRLIRMYPQSVYTKYALYYKTLSYVKENSERALDLIAELQRMYPLFRTEEITMARACCYYELGMQEELAEELKEIQRKHFSYPSDLFLNLNKIITDWEMKYEHE